MSQAQVISQPDIPEVQFSRRGGLVEARMGVTLDNHQDEVWSALTESQLLPQWLAPGQIDPRVGGAVRLDFGDSGVVVSSAVSAIDPQRLLEFSWSGPGEPMRPVRFELEPLGPVTRLTLTLTVPGAEDVGRSAAGWAAHLEMLACALAGVPIKFPFDLFKAARDHFRAHLAAEAIG